MLIRRERPADIPGVQRLYQVGFEHPTQGDLVAKLRVSPDWIDQLSLVAAEDDTPVAHVLCTRGFLDPAGIPVLAFGPLVIDPEWQGKRLAVPLMHSMICAAEARDEPAILLFGDTDFYAHFGFEPATAAGITPGPTGPHGADTSRFLIRTLAGYDPSMTGTFRFSDAFLAT